MSSMSVVQRKKVKGMTLLEVIIVLGIMGVIAAGVVVLAQRAIDSQNITKLAQSLNTIQTAMVQSFRGKANYPVASADDGTSAQLRTALVSMGRVSATDFVNPFTGDDLVITSVAANGVADKAFLIRVASLTGAQCQAIVTGAADLFSFVEVVDAAGEESTDVHVSAEADKGEGVLKSTNGAGAQFDVTNITHISTLCGGDAGLGGTYDVLFGSR